MVRLADSEPLGEQRPVIRRLVGVYNANGTVRGELAYWIGARLGTAHCALCDITHGTIRERDDWKTCRATLAVPFNTYHLNDQPDEIRALNAGTAPIVIADTDHGPKVLLGANELAACDGSPEQLLAAIDHAVEREDLRLPA
jgi:hypothetical protein